MTIRFSDVNYSDGGMDIPDPGVLPIYCARENNGKLCDSPIFMLRVILVIYFLYMIDGAALKLYKKTTIVFMAVCR